VNVEGIWKRAAAIFGSKRTDGSAKTVLYHLITRNVGPFAIRLGGAVLWVRDYREVAIPEMEDPYLEAAGVPAS
jgi:hypothetical protein